MSEPAEKLKVHDPVAVDADEDLDELDDVLSEFNPPTKSSQSYDPTSPTVPTSDRPAFGRKRTNTRVDQAPVSIPGSGIPASGALDASDEVDESLLSDEFTKELAKNMEDLMKELVSENKKEGGGEEDKDAETQKMFKAAWEAMLIEGMNGMVPGGQDGVGDESAATGTEEKAKSTGGDFQSRIKQTMDKLKESDSNMKTQAGSSGAPDTLEGLLQSLQDLGLDNDEEDPEFNGFLENVMGQLMSKEVLYPPLKELSENFPPYLERPPEPISPSDKERFEAQLAAVKKILAVFEQPGYDDKDPEASKKIVDLMEELQSHGSPPEAVMGPLPPGMGLGENGMPEGCVIG
ncbi:Peroxisome chaperone and import receptor [Marasmius crinis-equi]|uniref:Peroxisome chaperone and import receptor n=1 Tax=Marasmius crinis-equi TaxID=585013 RepID=A0ABR3G0B6_9AGAR